MHHRSNRNQGEEWVPHRSRWIRMGLCLAALVFSAVPFEFSQMNQPRQSLLMPEANRMPDANDQMRMREQQAKKVSYEVANTERQRQIVDDSAKLVELATQLKTEVDKTSKDTLSLAVIRKAEDIEKLAHSVQQKMKLTMAAR